MNCTITWKKRILWISCTAAKPLCGEGGRDDKAGYGKRRGRRHFMVDIAVPRDIEVEVGQIEGVSLLI